MARDGVRASGRAPDQGMREDGSQTCSKHFPID
jgi:hypothetical protein